MVKIRTPITVNFEGRYVPPGTTIDLPKAEADDFIRRFGEYEGPAIVGDQAPAVNAADAASIAALNLHNAINSRPKGTAISGAPSAAPASTEPPVIDPPVDLDGMKKDELLAEAERLGVEGVKATDTKPEIIEKIEAFLAEKD